MSDAIIEVDALALRRGERTILDGATLRITRGSIVVLMGASGSGKTTLLRAMAGLEPFQGGRLVVDDVRLDSGGADAAAIRHLRRKVGMVFQFHCLFEHLTALANICLAPVHVHRRPPAEAELRAKELLRSMGVEHRASALPRELSGGEAQRVAIARALATDPPVLLMDEPTASLDPARRTELAGQLRSMVGRQRTLVIATHDEDFAQAVASEIRQIRAGRIVD